MEYMDAKTIIQNTKGLNRDYLAFEYVMNIYWGCTHGCIYCYARSDYYQKNRNFECIRVKKDALRIIRDDLLKKKKRGVVFTAGMSDAYNPEEKEQNYTRNALELINAFRFGICILTKSDLVTRDTGILMDINEHSPASVNFTITCSDDETSRKVEPFVSRTSERFKAIEHLTKNGIICGVLMDPMLPYINDTKENVQEMVKMAKQSGVEYMYISTQVTMTDVQREYFYEEAEKHYPGVSEKYKERYKEYYYCRSPHGKKLWNTFVEACEKEGMRYDMRAANRLIRRKYDSVMEQTEFGF